LLGLGLLNALAERLLMDAQIGSDVRDRTAALERQTIFIRAMHELDPLCRYGTIFVCGALAH
jgi:hypothetical protein